jgi:hypothetical protein
MTRVPVNRVVLGAKALAMTSIVAAVSVGGKECVRGAAPRVIST